LDKRTLKKWAPFAIGGLVVWWLFRKAGAAAQAAMADPNRVGPTGQQPVPHATPPTP
jgi:hypothetical protein